MSFSAFDTAMNKMIESSSFSTDVYFNGVLLGSGLFDYDFNESGEIIGNKPIFTIPFSKKGSYPKERVITINSIQFRVEESRDDLSTNQTELTLLDLRALR